jgi:hypothetical protein
VSKTDAVEIDLLKLFTGQATTIFTTTVITPYIALYTTAPTESTGGTEVSGSSYARQSMPAANWGTPAAGSVSNTVACTFPAVTSAGYTVLGAGLATAVTAGTLLRYQAITSTAIAIGDQGNFAIGAITFTED